MPETMNRGVPPTARNARTGEFTPPGVTTAARSKSVWDTGASYGKGTLFLPADDVGRDVVGDGGRAPRLVGPARLWAGCQPPRVWDTGGREG
ncbi:hypothetical protein GCM10020221_36460 [Streptomyces thioluteus]|uniref:Uncharacterized protein n=1 Tax=Streptomyces thioluteus TaxID=66431 RepID=A0ABN3X6S4_STRTU